MKRLALVAAVLVVAACSKADETADTTTPAMAPAPAPATMDSAHMMDTTKMTMDTTKMDTTKTP